MYEATPEDFNRLTGIRDGAGSGSGGPSGVFVARLQGLPYRVSQQDIVRRVWLVVICSLLGYKDSLL